MGPSDEIAISIWNHRKVQKKQGSGFLGCVRLSAKMILRLKDTGFQRLNLSKETPADVDQVKGQIIVSLVSRAGLMNAGASTTPLAVVEPGGDVRGPNGSSSNMTNGLDSSRNMSGDSLHSRDDSLTGNLANLSINSDHGGGGGGSSSTATAAALNDSQSSRSSASGRRSGAASSASGSRDLPEGWEERRTPSGQKYYVNHVTQTTQWERPKVRPQVNGTAGGRDQRGSPDRLVSPSRVNLMCQERNG